MHEQRGRIGKYPEMLRCSQGILSQILSDCKWANLSSYPFCLMQTSPYVLEEFTNEWSYSPLETTWVSAVETN